MSAAEPWRRTLRPCPGRPLRIGRFLCRWGCSRQPALTTASPSELPQLKTVLLAQGHVSFLGQPAPNARRREIKAPHPQPARDSVQDHPHCRSPRRAGCGLCTLPLSPAPPCPAPGTDLRPVSNDPVGSQVDWPARSLLKAPRGDKVA